MHSFLDTV